MRNSNKRKTYFCLKIQLQETKDDPNKTLKNHASVSEIHDKY